GESDGKGKVSGKVVVYSPDNSITIEEPSGQKTELALKPNGKTQIVRPDDTPLPEGETVKPGDTVSAAAISRGLAYVWRRHVDERMPVHGGYFLLAFVVGF